MMMQTPQTPVQFSYLEGLNPVQRLAVETTEGAVLVLAGAGTGKTRVLTTRLGHILQSGLATPPQILAVTFTNRAAQEMKRRVAGMTGAPSVEGWWLGTFHALAAKMLRRHAECVGLRQNFTILDEDDQIRLMKQLVEAENIDPKKYPPRVIINIIQKWKDRAETPDMVAADDAGGYANGKLPKLYRAYQERLQILNACDFGDLLLHVVTIFRDPQYRDILEKYQRQFKYILVDEYQDTNVGQYLWLRLLAQQNKNICCVGDDDQSIYGWRGAEIGNILRFEKDFSGATLIRLEQNYRSTKHILAAANGVIAHNNGRLGKELWSADDDGEKVSLRGVWDGRQEAESITADIDSLRRHGLRYSDIAILVRAGFQMREFEEKFIREGIPYRVIGGPRFYERQEIRDAIAYMRVVVQQDDDLAFQRIVNVPKRGVGDATVRQINLVARDKNISMFAALRLLLETGEMRPKLRGTLRDLVRDFDRWQSQVPHMPHDELAGIILDESGYTAMWQTDKSPEAAGRLENLKEFVSALHEFESLDIFLEHVALVMEAQENTDAEKVSIMTIHSAKGLEFNTVFLPGWEEGLFPSQRSMDENGMGGLEEERRLAYVGITRARKKAFIYFAANRFVYGNWTACMPSRFIEELPKDDIDVQTATGIHADTHHARHIDGGFRHRGRAATYDDTPAIAQVSRHLESTGGYTAGSRVFHQKFGYGTVETVDGDKLDIRFDKAGRKKVIDTFVTAAR